MGVKQLLGRKDANPDQPNLAGGAPLALATKRGHEGIVKQLPGREGANPGGRDR